MALAESARLCESEPDFKGDPADDGCHQDQADYERGPLHSRLIRQTHEESQVGPHLIAAHRLRDSRGGGGSPARRDQTKGGQLMEPPHEKSPAINAHLAADLIADGEQLPVFVWTIDHPAGRVLVDTGLIDSRPEIEDMSPTPHPENIPRDVACIINTHLHYAPCGGNRLFPGVPIHVQARELADARSLDNYTFREWVDFDGATYVEHEGEAEVLPGIRLLPTPGHTDGHQSVLIETGGRPVVVGGDVAIWFGELDEPHTEGQLRVRALEPELVWLAHEREPWRPRQG